jgi:polysaccharide pyruvyl transferase WcaK-like protein
VKHVAVCGEIYSANAGDQAIHACLLHLLKRLDTGIETVSLDLSGRKGLSTGEQNSPGLRQRIAMWQSKPVLRRFYILMNAVYQSVHLRRLYAGEWGSALASAQALVIGGGQLLMDDGLNFPIKIAGAASQARRLGLPYHFSGCGVGRSWSATGQRLFEYALTKAESVTLRDHLSSQRLTRMLPQIQHHVTFDPAIWAADVYPATTYTGDPMIGLGVFNQGEANTHLTPGERFSAEAWMQLWVDLLGKLLASNIPVFIFTTGSTVDQQFAAALYTQAAARGWTNFHIAPRPTNPLMLVQSLQQCGVVVAARLHAAILSNAYGVNTVGLAWDEKVRAYYEETTDPTYASIWPTLPVNEIARTARA